MSQPNNKLPDSEREREIVQARAEFFAHVEAEGIQPFDFDAALGEGSDGQTQEEIRAEVDEFLEMLREWRSEGTRSVDS